MAGRQANVISAGTLRRVLGYTNTTHNPKRDRVIVLLSVKAGLRAAEIAKLRWHMVLDARGRIADYISIHDSIAKKGGGRKIPIHDDLRRALKALLVQDVDPAAPVVQSKRGEAMRPNSLVNWFLAMYRELGAAGCSSHSGRRTFITIAARNAHRAGCSLRDVQQLAGHRSIETTQGYIEGDTAGQRRLVSLL